MSKVVDEMVCLCGEVLRGKLDSEGRTIKGSLAAEYESHMIGPDHKASPGQWARAHDKMVEGREKAKSRQ
jgi:hypothetical protein